MVSFIKPVGFYVLCIAAFHVHAESYVYQSYLQDGTKSDVGYISLVETGQTATLQYFSGTAMSKCSRSALKASVVRSDQTLTITTEPLMGGCDTIRFIINSDGTGGFREVKSGDTWVRDEKDRVLVLKK